MMPSAVEDAEEEGEEAATPARLNIRPDAHCSNARKTSGKVLLRTGVADKQEEVKASNRGWTSARLAAVTGAAIGRP